MQIRYYKEYSRFLNRFMEFKVYGHAGRPIVIFPCQSGRFFEWEDRNMCNAAAPWIDSGKLQIFTVDSIDPESWDNNGPERPRIEMQERWYNYICEEFVPRLLEINREQGEDHNSPIITTKPLLSSRLNSSNKITGGSPQNIKIGRAHV